MVKLQVAESYKMDVGKGIVRLDSKTMEELDEYLNSQGWRPPRDTLAKLAVRNIWIRNRFFRKTLHDLHEDHKGLVVFIVRERALELELSETVHSLLKRSGFEVLFWKVLSPIEVERASKNIIFSYFSNK